MRLGLALIAWLAACGASPVSPLPAYGRAVRLEPVAELATPAGLDELWVGGERGRRAVLVFDRPPENVLRAMLVLCVAPGAPPSAGDPHVLVRRGVRRRTPADVEPDGAPVTRAFLGGPGARRARLDVTALFASSRGRRESPIHLVVEAVDAELPIRIAGAAHVERDLRPQVHLYTE